jgi:hypothetical protein
MDRDIAMARGTMKWWRALCFLSPLLLVGPAGAHAQDAARSCTLICDLEWKFEPTFTIENLVNRHRVMAPDGVTERVNRERVFETVLALDLKTKLPWLGFTAELSAVPFSDDNSAELEFETNFHWLTEPMSRGWVTSHFDVVDQFSPAERPSATRAYTHKLDFELDTAVHLFKWLPEGRWLRGLELETSLDYLATGIPKKGDVFADGFRYLDDASHWSFSFVIVIPMAPF